MVKEDRIAKDMKPLQKYAMAVLLYGSAARGGSTEKVWKDQEHRQKLTKEELKKMF